MQDTKRRIRRALETARDQQEFKEFLRHELGDKLHQIEQVYFGEGTRFVTLFLKPNIGPIMIEGTGWSKPLD